MLKYLGFEVNSGEANMSKDSELLQRAIDSQSQIPVFRLYAWKPRCVSIGRNQNFEPAYNQNIDTVRRLTGGRALLHDDELTYACISPVSIIPNGDSVIESYKYISQIWIDFFKEFGVNLQIGGDKKKSFKNDYCMLISTGADLCCNNKKIIGSAQYRTKGYLLQHGSIIFNYNREFLQELFNEKIDEGYITTVNEILPDITKEDFINRFEKFIVNRDFGL